MPEETSNINRQAMQQAGAEEERHRQSTAAPSPVVDHHSVLRRELSSKRAQLREALTHEETQTEAIRNRLASIEQMKVEAERKLQHRLKKAEDVRTSLAMVQAALDAES